MVFVTSIKVLWIVFCVIQKYEQMFMSSMRQYFLSTSSVHSYGTFCNAFLSKQQQARRLRLFMQKLFMKKKNIHKTPVQNSI